MTRYRRHLALPDGLCQLDRVDAELGGGVHQTERRGRHVANGRLNGLQLLRTRRAAAVDVAQVVRILAEGNAGLATGFGGRTLRVVAWHRTYVQGSWAGPLNPSDGLRL